MGRDGVLAGARDELVGARAVTAADRCASKTPAGCAAAGGRKSTPLAGVRSIHRSEAASHAAHRKEDALEEVGEEAEGCRRQEGEEEEAH
eukprot:scaffold327783_cov62-Tisochrysis_lutea.AAC.1